MQLISCCINYTFSEMQSLVIYPVCIPWNSIFKCISYAQTINITPTWIHLWVDLAEKPKRMCRAMITSSLPSLVNIHQSVLLERLCVPIHIHAVVTPPPQPFLHRNKYIKYLIKFFGHIINYLYAFSHL